LRTAPAIADAVSCLALELELYEKLSEGTLAVDTVAFAREYLLNRYPFDVATAADLLLPVLNDELLGQPLDDVFTIPRRLAALDVGSVPGVLARHLNPRDLVVVMVATASEVMPELEKRFPKAALEVVDYRDGLPLEGES
jgi:zinc protease